MSIIAEALKKVQKTSVKPERKPQDRTLSRDRRNISQPNIPQPKGKSPIFFVRLIVILVFFLSAITLFVLFRNDSRVLRIGSADGYKKAADVSAIINTAPSKPQPLEPVKEEKVPATAPIGSGLIPVNINELVKLNGIMYTPKKPLAVINGNIRGVGDYVEEFKILEIGKDFVKVGSAEEEYVLKLQR